MYMYVIDDISPLLLICAIRIHNVRAAHPLTPELESRKSVTACLVEHTDASYLNFQNAQIGYTFPERLTRKMRISRLRLYITCDNIIYWSRRQGLDPRYSFDGSTSYAVNSPVRTLSGGINITF